MRSALCLEREEALKAIDEQQTLLLLKDQERVVGLERRLRRVAAQELQRDLGERDLAYLTHRTPLAGRERTWKVGYS